MSVFYNDVSSRNKARRINLCIDRVLEALYWNGDVVYHKIQYLQVSANRSEYCIVQFILLTQRFADHNVVYSVGAPVKSSRYLLGTYRNSGEIQVGSKLEVIILRLVHVQEVVRRIDLVHCLDEYKL